jgi:tryptophan-rich sensory protein
MNDRPSLALKIVVGVIVCLGVGFLSGLSTASSISGWYQTINKPPFTPPGWLFAPVWTSLYTIMGVAAAWIWHTADGKQRNKALSVFGVHLLLNAFWTQLFFGFQLPVWAFVEIIVLLGTIIYFSILFYRIKPWTGWIQIPYILWVTFASVLTGTIAWMN